jgi:VanZ family protein
VPPALWAALILVLTSIPNLDVGGAGFPGADKLVHGTLYFVFAWLVARAVGTRNGRAAQLVQTLVIVALFGALDEIHQHWIPGRSADLLDWGADFLGALLGVVAARLSLFRREPVT